MKIDEHDVGRYRRQGQTPVVGKSGGGKILPIFLGLVIVAGLVGAWRMGIISDLLGSAQGNSTGGSLLGAAGSSTNTKELAAQIELLLEANEKANQQFQKLNDELQEIRNGLGELDKKIAAAGSGRAAPSSSRVNALSASIEKLDSKNQAEIAKIQEMNAEITENFEKINQDLVNLDALYRNQQDSITQVENYLNTLNARVTDLER